MGERKSEKNRRRRIQLGLLTGLLLLLAASGIVLAGGSRRSKYEYWWEVPVIAHAGGGINGRTNTNSQEALELAVKNGHQVIEVDLSLTSDGELVLSHGWEEDSAEAREVETGVPDLQTFCDTRVCRKYTPVTMKDLLAWMKRHKEVYIVTDTKCEEAELRQQFGRLVELAGQDSRLLDRFVVQVYDTEMYDTIQSIYAFPNVMYATYQTADKDLAYWNQVVEDCASRGIQAVSVSREYVSTKKHPSQPYVEILKDAGLKVCVHTVNTITGMETLLDAGADIVMSDFLVVDDMQYLQQ